MTQPTDNVELPAALLAEIGRIAQAENRPAGELLADMMQRYLKDQRWQTIVRDGKTRGQGLSPEEIDAKVNTAIADYRNEHRR